MNIKFIIANIDEMLKLIFRLIIKAISKQNSRYNKRRQILSSAVSIARKKRDQSKCKPTTM